MSIFDYKMAKGKPFKSDNGGKLLLRTPQLTYVHIYIEYQRFTAGAIPKIDMFRKLLLPVLANLGACYARTPWSEVARRDDVSFTYN